MNDPVVDSLRLIVADTCALAAQTQLCHWNVRGPMFFALHQAFEDQYNEMATAVDEIAERIRAKGALSPGGLGSLAQISGIEEIAEDASSDAMIRHLIKAHEKTVTDLKTARDTAGDAVDSETEDMMIGRIEVHEKTLWMLRSCLEE